MGRNAGSQTFTIFYSLNPRWYSFETSGYMTKGVTFGAVLSVQKVMFDNHNQISSCQYASTYQRAIKQLSHIKTE